MPNDAHELQDLVVNEVSLVDDPANEGAVMEFYKKKEMKPKTKEEKLFKFLSKIFGSKTKKDGSSYESLPDLSSSQVDDQDEVDELGSEDNDSPQNSNQGENMPEENKSSQSVASELDSLRLKLSDMETKYAALEAEHTQLKSLNDMSEEEQEACAGMPEDEALKFKSMKKDERTAYLDSKKASKADAMEKSNAESEDIKKMRSEVESIKKQNEDLKGKLQTEELQKRAEKEIPKLPGTVEERALVLKSIEAISDPASKEIALKALKHANDLMAKNFEEIGTSKGADGGDEVARFHTESEAIKKSEKITIEKAMDRMRTGTPEQQKLWKAFQLSEQNK